jgi:outer membrane lipoprotein
MRAIALCLLSLPLLAGCATSPNDCRRPIGDRGLTPAVAAQRADAVGQAITWGGTLVGSRNLEDATELEVLAYPLDDCGRPRTGDRPLGRFIVRRPGYLETADLGAGRAVTASGRIIATAEGQIGEADYRFPVIEDANPRVWPERRAAGPAGVRPWISIGVGGGSGWSGGGVGVAF